MVPGVKIFQQPAATQPAGYSATYAETMLVQGEGDIPFCQF
jgi:hypothetical protein